MTLRSTQFNSTLLESTLLYSTLLESTLFHSLSLYPSISNRLNLIDQPLFPTISSLDGMFNLDRLLTLNPRRIPFFLSFIMASIPSRGLSLHVLLALSDFSVSAFLRIDNQITILWGILFHRKFFGSCSDGLTVCTHIYRPNIELFLFKLLNYFSSFILCLCFSSFRISFSIIHFSSFFPPSASRRSTVLIFISAVLIHHPWFLNFLFSSSSFLCCLRCIIGIFRLFSICHGFC